MSGVIRTDLTPLTSPEELVAYFHGAAKPMAEWRVGIEHEKIAVSAGGRAVPYDGPRGIEALLGRLERRTGRRGTREDGRLLGVVAGNEQLTLEPGGQIELAAPPLPTAGASVDVLLRHLREVSAAADELGISFLGAGLHPWATREEVAWLPRARYRIMRDYLATRGGLAHDMMKRTATVQANFDFDSEETAVDKIRVAFGVTSIVTALFAASPLVDGRPSGYRSWRAAIWLDTDEARCGLLPFALSQDFTFRDYVEWALDVPMFLLIRGAEHRPVENLTFRQFMATGWQGEHATLGDWVVHLSTLFPEVRLKRFIEVRGADAGPLPMVTGLGPLWRGILDDRDARAAAWKLVRGAAVEDLQRLRRDVPRLGLSARLLGHSLADLAVELCRISQAGLAALPGGKDDAALVEPLLARARAGRSPADDFLDDYRQLDGDPDALIARWKLAV